MIEDRQLTREVTWLCNNGEYKTFKQVAVVQLRWNSDVPEVDPNPLGFVSATQWQLTPPERHEHNVVDQSAQLAAVTKERDELRAELDRLRRALSVMSQGCGCELCLGVRVSDAIEQCAAALQPGDDA